RGTLSASAADADSSTSRDLLQVHGDVGSQGEPDRRDRTGGRNHQRPRGGRGLHQVHLEKDQLRIDRRGLRRARPEGNTESGADAMKKSNVESQQLEAGSLNFQPSTLSSLLER